MWDDDGGEGGGWGKKKDPLGKQKNPWGKDEKGTELFIANYPTTKPIDAILTALSMIVLSRVGGLPTIVEKEPIAEGLRVAVPNNLQFRAMLECNGAYVLNQKIWIIKFPEAVGSYMDYFKRVFARNTSNGVVNLSNIQAKLRELEVPDSLVKGATFTNRDFVEFLFYRLGTDSRDQRFFVEAVLLNNNGITNVQSLSPFLVFLPTLRRLVVSDNPIKNKEQLFIPEHPYVEVVCERVGQQQAGQNQRNRR